MVDAGFSLWYCVSRFLWTFFPCPAVSPSSSSFCSHWLMEQVLVTAVKLWSYCMVTSWQFWWSWLVSHTEYWPVLSLGEMSPRRKWAVPESALCDSHCTRGSSLSTWAWRQVQIFPPGACKKRHHQCLTFLLATSPVLLRKAWELWLNITI